MTTNTTNTTLLRRCLLGIVATVSVLGMTACQSGNDAVGNVDSVTRRVISAQETYATAYDGQYAATVGALKSTDPYLEVPDGTTVSLTRYSGGEGYSLQVRDNYSGGLDQAAMAAVVNGRRLHSLRCDGTMHASQCDITYGALMARGMKASPNVNVSYTPPSE